MSCNPKKWADKLLHKPGREIWNELRGNSMWRVLDKEKQSYATMIKSKTFTPPSSDRSFVYSRLIRNAESVFMKARRYRLRARTIGLVLRTNDFRHEGVEAGLNHPTSCALEAVPLVRRMFDRIFTDGCLYRATMVVLGKLEDDKVEQYELFEDRLKIEKFRRITLAIDTINGEYGKHTVRSATSLFLENAPRDVRQDLPERRSQAFAGETQRQRLAIPRAEIKI